MIAPQIPDNEAGRQAAVERYSVLDTLPEPNFDNITALMSEIAGTPISLISMLDHDRNYLKSHHGIPFDESPRRISFCGHAINSDDSVMVVNDALNDHRFADNPLVTEQGVRFYAGAPLVTPDGYRLGTLCIFDMEPRDLDHCARTALLSLARQVEIVLEHRRANLELVKINKKLISAQQILEARNGELKHFARDISHDIKSPIAKIALFSNILAEDGQAKLDDNDLACIDRVQNTAESLCKYIDCVLSTHTNNVEASEALGPHSLRDIMDELLALASVKPNVDISLPDDEEVLYLNKSSLLQILLNLVTNAIKYNDKETIEVVVEIELTETAYKFCVKDNGVGIPNDKLGTIFEPFETLSDTDHDGNTSTGMGLSKVRQLVANLEGEIHVESTEKKGSCFFFWLPRVKQDKAAA